MAEKKGKFGLNNLLSDISKQENTNSFKVDYIHIDKLVPSEENFYRTDEINGLKLLIEYKGLQQNLVVWKDDDVFRILSGHRRHKALKTLCDEGKKEFEIVPCLVIYAEDKYDAELQLLFGNSENRQHNDFEKMTQAIRLMELLAEKEKSGEKIEGRKRDIVAEMLKISKTQVQRYQSIDKNLIPELKEEFKGGTVNLTTAAELATLDEDTQQEKLEAIKSGEKVTATTISKEKAKSKDENVEIVTKPIESEVKNTSAQIDEKFWQFEEQESLFEKTETSDSEKETEIKTAEPKKIEVEKAEPKKVPIMGTNNKRVHISDKDTVEIVNSVKREYEGKLNVVSDNIEKYKSIGRNPNINDVDEQMKLQTIVNALELYDQFVKNPMVYMPNEFAHQFWKNEDGYKVLYIGAELKVKNLTFYTSDNGYNIENFIFTESKSGIAVSFKNISEYERDAENELEKLISTKMSELGYTDVTELETLEN